MNNKINNKDIINYLSVIASGIITNIIQNILFTSHFEQLEEKNKTLIVEVNNFSTTIQLVIVICTFLGLWILIGYLIPAIISFINTRLKFRRKIIYSNKQIFDVYNRVKKTTLNIITEYDLLSPSTDADLRNIACTDIYVCINQLYEVFRHKNKIQIKTVKSVFRDDTTVNNIGKKISRCEYNSLINIMKSVLNSTLSKDSNDYKSLKNKLDELYSMINIK